MLKVVLLTKKRCCRSGAAAHSTDRRLPPPVVLLTIEALPARHQAEPASTGCGFLLAASLRMEALMTAATVHIAAAPSQA